ncbi:MAG: adenylate/guanylate cyclase domain-containing protein [Bacteroidota bacterium]
MKISPKVIWNLKRILPFGLIWLVIACLLMWTEYAVVTDQTKTPESAIPITPAIVLFATVSIFLVGCLVGMLEVFYVNSLFKNLSFPRKILGKFLLYTVLLSILVLILYMLAASLVSKSPVFSKSVWDQYVVFFFSITHISTGVQLLFSLLTSLLYAEISENIGQNVLLNFFTGKYHKPVVEDRIFMFVDMKDSTPIAESLGHEKYFDLLRSYYFHFSDAIIHNHGQVYQYVGDEIVITWKLKNGLARNHCLQCFYDMKSALAKKEKFYADNFGVTPDFKAALHIGEVTTGEIGALKKDIFFTGDVLNTTARILGLCGEYQEDLLLSKELSEQLDLGGDFTVRTLANASLKGKKEKVEIVSVRPSA